MFHTKTPFVLLGLNSDDNLEMMKVFEYRGYNIFYHTADSNYTNVCHTFFNNKRPTVIVNCFTDEGREQYRDIPAIIVRDGHPFEVREYDVDLGFYYSLADLDQIMHDYGKETAQEAPEQDEEDEEDDDYAPICFTSQNGFYDEGLEML